MRVMANGGKLNVCRLSQSAYYDRKGQHNPFGYLRKAHTCPAEAIGAHNQSD